MSKWFEEIDCKNSNVIYSRIRLARNWDEYVFPSRMTATQCGEMVERLGEGLKGLKDQDGRDLSYSQLDQMQELEKMALRERRILNMACVNRKEPSGLLLSADESGSIVLGGDDHIRMQILSPGLKLDELWQKADVLDDYVNERFSYACDEKYGYLTSFPTNVGTGLRACVVLHLPTLSQVRKFQSIVADMSRFGTAIRGLYGEGSDNYGSLYEVSNQRTLGQSEKDARIFISQLMAGEEDGLMKFNEECSLYSLIIGIKPANLNLWARRPLDKDELDAVRAAYIRQNLPEIV